MNCFYIDFVQSENLQSLWVTVVKTWILLWRALFTGKKCWKCNRSLERVWTWNGKGAKTG